MEDIIRGLALLVFGLFAYSVQGQHLTPGVPASKVLTSVSPIVIDGKKDVVIQDRRVSNPNGSCILVKNYAQNILIENSEIGPCSNHGIEVLNSSNVTVRNVFVHDISKDGVSGYRTTSLVVYNSRLERTGSGVFVYQSSRTYVDHNRFLNMQGPGFSMGGYRGQMVQFGEVNSGGNVIRCNVGENVPGQSHPEDGINFWRSLGDPADPIQIIGNKIKGGGPSTTGTGINLGDSAGAYIIAKDNIVVDSGAIGMGIGGGHHMQMLNNLVYGGQQPWTNVGMSVWNWNNYDPICYAHTVQGNSVNWANKTGIKATHWDGGNCGPIAGWDNNNWNSSIGPSIWNLTIPSCSQ